MVSRTSCTTPYHPSTHPRPFDWPPPVVRPNPRKSSCGCGRLVSNRGRRLGTDAVRADWVGYVRLTRNSDSTPAGELVRRAPDDFPDPLLDEASLTVCAGSTQPALVRVTIARETPPGVYHGTLPLRAGAMLLRTVQLTVEVYPVTLPRIPSLRVTNWFSSRAIAQQHRVEEWSDSARAEPVG